MIANTHILKEPGNIKVHRTRVIHIYEADYNLAMGLKWRQALYEAEECRVMHDGQYGSRPLRMAGDPVLIEQLQLDISTTVTRKTLILTNYDATSCYDRIVPNLAMIVSRKFGVAESVANSNARTCFGESGLSSQDRSWPSSERLLTFGRVSHIRHRARQCQLAGNLAIPIRSALHLL